MRNSSPLISLEYSSGWDPLAKGGTGSAFSQEVFESFMFNLEDVERATQCFSEANLLGKTNFSTVYKGMLRDGSTVAVKCIAKTSCKSNEDEFLKGLKLLTVLKHENLVRLRGFCCSKGRRECFLIYEYVPNGNLLQYLDVDRGTNKVLEWSTRITIINGIAEGQSRPITVETYIFLLSHMLIVAFRFCQVLNTSMDTKERSQSSFIRTYQQRRCL